MRTQKSPINKTNRALIERIIGSPKVVGSLQAPTSNRYGGYFCTIDIDRVRHEDNALLGQMTALGTPMVVVLLVPVANTTEAKRVESLTYDGPELSEKSNPPNECKIHRLMEITGLTKARIRQLVQKGVMVSLARGVYDLDKSLKNYIIEKNKEASGRGGQDYSVERTRKLRAQATEAELDLAEKKGELASVEEFKGAAFEMGHKVRNALESLIPRLSAELAAAKTPAKVRNLLKPEVTNILTRLSLNKDTQKRKNGNAGSSGKAKGKKPGPRKRK